MLGVGNFDVLSHGQIGSQSRGPTSDNRIKPDIQALTNTRTASSASDTATKAFGGTSGATPYAADVAALLRNWLRGNTGSVDPGQVYARVILPGQWFKFLKKTHSTNLYTHSKPSYAIILPPAD